jgi:hypothetical protein
VLSGGSNMSSAWSLFEAFGPEWNLLVGHAEGLIRLSLI